MGRGGVGRGRARCEAGKVLHSSYTCNLSKEFFIMATNNSYISRITHYEKDNNIIGFICLKLVHATD